MHRGCLKWVYTNSWKVYSWKSIYKWMKTGVTPISGNHHSYIYVYIWLYAAISQCVKF